MRGRTTARPGTLPRTAWPPTLGSERILGVGIVGINAGDVLTEAVVAIEMGATARDLGETIHPHPTLSETLGNAAEAFLGTATEIYRPRPVQKS